MIEYDLHVHSTYSDGTLTPDELIIESLKQGLKGVSITDHDTIDALPVCEKLIQKNKYNIDFIPGIELSTEYQNQEIHILGYFIDYKNHEFQKVLEGFKQERYARMINMISRMNELGYKITLSDVITSDSQQNSIGRPHIARALVRKGYFSSLNEVFDKLLGSGKPGYVDRFKINSTDAIKLLRKYNGIPVLAHPGLIKVTHSILENMIVDFINAGLLGIEVFHSDHTIETSLIFTKIVNKYGLITTGGSDFHSLNSGRDIKIGSKGVTSYDIEKLKRLLELFII